MENILMKFCRETYRCTPSKVAAFLGITLKEYQAIETGKLLITPQQATQLGKLYKVNGNYFYQSALQLELLHSRNEMIKALSGSRQRSSVTESALLTG